MTGSKFLLINILFQIGLTATVFAQTSSVLSTGLWIKLGINEDGIYKITHTDLQSYGINPATLDPGKIRIFGNGGGMLPQKINTPRVKDLNEVAIKVIGEEDGIFNVNDFILFYANGPR